MNPNIPPGLSKYPDLQSRFAKEAANATCCGGRDAIMRKYARIVQDREKIENERKKPIPNRGSRTSQNY